MGIRLPYRQADTSSFLEVPRDQIELLIEGFSLGDKKHKSQDMHSTRRCLYRLLIVDISGVVVVLQFLLRLTNEN